MDDGDDRQGCSSQLPGKSLCSINIYVYRIRPVWGRNDVQPFSWIFHKGNLGSQLIHFACCFWTWVRLVCLYLCYVVMQENWTFTFHLHLYLYLYLFINKQAQMLSVDRQDEVAWATAHLTFLPELPLRRRWINDITFTIVLLLAMAKRLLDYWLLYQDYRWYSVLCISTSICFNSKICHAFILLWLKVVGMPCPATQKDEMKHSGKECAVLILWKKHFL